MKKFWEILFRIIRTLVCVPAVILLAIVLTPLYLLMIIGSLGIAVVEDIWEITL